MEVVMGMQQSAVTTEGQPVMAGVFPLVGTHGIPLEVILHRFKESGQVVDWPDYVAGALADGHKPRTVKARIAAAVGDIYGPDHREAVETRLEQLL
jgi:alanyl-tRNA synthetase